VGKVLNPGSTGPESRSELEIPPFGFEDAVGNTQSHPFSTEKSTQNLEYQKKTDNIYCV
jgi:hypothetical protein